MRSFALAGVLALIACTEKNPLYCDHDGDCTSGACDKTQHLCGLTSGDGGTDGLPPMHCMIDENCMSTAPHCIDGICRQCAVSTDCGNGMVCQPDHSCGPCAQDADCAFAGGACTAGICPPQADVAWADCAAICPGDGSATTPFCHLNAAVATGRKYIVMTARTACTYDAAQIVDRAQQIDGRGGTVQVTDGESGIFVTGANSDAYVHDLVVTSQSSAAVNGISVASNGKLRIEHVIVHNMPGNTSSGIYSQSANITVRKSLVYLIAGWGMQIDDSMYRVENTFIVDNGSVAGTPMAGTGGVRIRGNSGGAFVYNTIARNTFEIPPGNPPKGAGLECDATVIAIDSLLIENLQGLTLADTLGMCDTTMGSITTTGALPMMANDIFVDPSQPAASVSKNMGFHVKTSATMVVHHGVLQPSPAAPDDYDGEPRPAMTTPGADEPLP
jgi:hypothetical protein